MITSDGEGRVQPELLDCYQYIVHKQLMDKYMDYYHNKIHNNNNDLMYTP